MTLTKNGFPNSTLEQIHWLTLYLKLPEGGIDQRFPTESSCEERFRQIRWPDGPICPNCSKKDLGNLTREKFYPCRNCKKQFSDTSGTLLHSKTLDFGTYFRLSAEIVCYEMIQSPPSSHALKDRYGIAYATAVRLRKNLTKSLVEADGGLLGRCICVEALIVPQDVDLGSDDHLAWLQAEDRRRRWLRLGIE